MYFTVITITITVYCFVIGTNTFIKYCYCFFQITILTFVNIVQKNNNESVKTITVNRKKTIIKKGEYFSHHQIYCFITKFSIKLSPKL
jgi:hypothetical protein